MSSAVENSSLFNTFFEEFPGLGDCERGTSGDGILSNSLSDADGVEVEGEDGFFASSRLLGASWKVVVTFAFKYSSRWLLNAAFSFICGIPPHIVSTEVNGSTGMRNDQAPTVLAKGTAETTLQVSYSASGYGRY